MSILDFIVHEEDKAMWFSKRKNIWVSKMRLSDKLNEQRELVGWVIYLGRIGRN